MNIDEDDSLKWGLRGVLDKRLYLREYFLCFRPSHRIDAAHLSFVLFSPSYRERILRINEKNLAQTFLLLEISQLLVIHKVTTGHRLNDGRIARREEMEERHQFCLLLEEAFGLRQNDQISLETLLLEVTKRYGIAYSAIEKELSIYVDGLRNEWH